MVRPEDQESAGRLPVLSLAAGVHQGSVAMEIHLTQFRLAQWLDGFVSTTRYSTKMVPQFGFAQLVWNYNFTMVYGYNKS